MGAETATAVTQLMAMNRLISLWRIDISWKRCMGTASDHSGAHYLGPLNSLELILRPACSAALQFTSNFTRSSSGTECGSSGPAARLDLQSRLKCRRKHTLVLSARGKFFFTDGKLRFDP